MSVGNLLKIFTTVREVDIANRVKVLISCFNYIVVYDRFDLVVIKN